MNARTEHGLFVAIARHLIAEGWNVNDDMHSPDRLREISWDVAMDRFELIERDTYWSGRRLLDLHVTKIQEVADHLVTAGVLPESMHSLHAGYVPAVDSDGTRVMVTKNSDGTLVVQLWGDETEWPPPEHYEPLFRRVAAEVDVESTDPITAMTR